MSSEVPSVFRIYNCVTFQCLEYPSFWSIYVFLCLAISTLVRVSITKTVHHSVGTRTPYMRMLQHSENKWNCTDCTTEICQY
jgi:hypothetical protein